MEGPRIWTPDRRGLSIGAGVSAPADRFRRFVSVGAPAYTTSPYGVPGAIAWYKADAETFQDSALTTAATTDSAPVGGWKDQTGLGHHLLQATSSARPTLRLSQRNGLPSIRFNGTNSQMQATYTLNPAYHIFLVMKMNAWTNSGQILVGQTGNYGIIMNISTPILRVWNGTGLSPNNSDLAIGAWGIVQSLMNAGSSGHYKVNALTNSTVASGSAAGGLSLGADFTPTGFTNIDVGEMIVYNVALSDADETTIRNALATRWGMSMADLPAPTTFWNMNAAAGANEVDTVGGLVLTQSNGVGSAAGIIGGARTFASASSQFLSTPDAAALKLNVASTIAVWVRFDSLSASFMSVLAKLGSATAAQTEYKLYKNSSGLMSMYIQGNPTTGVSAQFQSLSVGTWYCLFGQWDGVNVSGAANGGALVNQAAAYLPQALTGSLFVGSQTSDTPLYLDGAVDAIAIWKGTVLTSAQRANFYNGGAGREWVSGAWTP